MASKAKQLDIPFKKDKIEFNPQANYSWKAEDEFTVSGKEFEILHASLAAAFNTQQLSPQHYVMLHEGLKVTLEVLKRNVEDGKIVEVPNPPQQ